MYSPSSLNAPKFFGFRTWSFLLNYDHPPQTLDLDCLAPLHKRDSVRKLSISCNLAKLWPIGWGMTSLVQNASECSLVDPYDKRLPLAISPTFSFFEGPKRHLSHFWSKDKTFLEKNSNLLFPFLEQSN